MNINGVEFEVPICPEHNRPLNPPKKGDPATTVWYCSKSLGNGQWCKHKAMAKVIGSTPRPAQEPASVPVGGSVNGHQDPGSQVIVAALEFAGSVFHGSQDAEKALECLRKALEAVR